MFYYRGFSCQCRGTFMGGARDISTLEVSKRTPKAASLPHMSGGLFCTAVTKELTLRNSDNWEDQEYGRDVRSASETGHPPCGGVCWERRVSVRETGHKGSGDLTLALSSRQELASSLEKSLNPFFKRFLKLASMLLCTILQLSKHVDLGSSSSSSPPPSPLPAFKLYQHWHAYSHIHIRTCTHIYQAGVYIEKEHAGAFCLVACYLSFWVRVTSVNIVFSRFIHFPRSSSFSTEE